ncbi:hypothetical protein AX14_012337 [Amanita brunnescens Koide BX004]|nr:hypothetical protein AX14_012337 [Amanita brunnescens Koide BX004]
MMHSRLIPSGVLYSHRFFSNLPGLPNRAVVYTQNGNPTQVLRVIDYPRIPPPLRQTVNIRYLLSPINPADINVVEGVYPSKPLTVDCLATSGEGSPEKPVFVGGNEGLAKVVRVGDGVTELQEGDWVIIKKQQVGTWCTERNVPVDDLLRLDAQHLTEVQAATITVNPPTAYNMLHEFIKLESGDWVAQNGANSAVGQAVIQIAASEGLKTLNFIRNRENYQATKDYLLKLGATHVMTYDDLEDNRIQEKIKSLTLGKKVRLGLNCVGGKETISMARLLGDNSHLVSYGAMSKQPLSLPTSLFIFKNLKAHGFWQSRWYKDKSQSEREALMHRLAQLMLNNKVMR